MHKQFELHGDELARPEEVVLILELRLQRDIAGRRVDAIVDKAQRAFDGSAAGAARHRACFDRPFARVLLYEREFPLRNGEPHENRMDLIDHDERRVRAGARQVALSHLDGPGLAGDGSANGRVVEIELRRLDIRAIGIEHGLERRRARRGLIGLRAGHKILLRERGIPLRIAIRIFILCHIARQHRLRLLQRGAVRHGVDGEEHLVKIYTFYRQVEHRLQWRNDAQVHHLNNEIEELQHLSESTGFSEPRDFLRTITHYQEKIKKTFADTIFSEKEQTEAVIVNEPLLAQSPKFTKRLEIIRAGNKYTLMSDAAKHNFENIIKVVILLKPDPPENVLIDFLDFLEKISRRAAYLSLLSEYPIAIKRVIQLFESSKWSVQYLVRYPHLLDEILVKNTSINLIENPGNYWKDWLRVLQRRLDAVSAEENATELMMNILRDAHHAEIFQILLADLGIGLNQRLSVEKVSDQLSQLADLIITETLERIWKQMSQRFGYQEHFSSLGFGVIAYGKLGGKELGYGSDLDLVFIYDEDISTLPKDDVPERYIQLVRKLITWLNTSTSSGIIFDIDTRLRPNGESGLMVTSLKSFEKYQFNDGNNTAWIWEHQALSRARYCSGDVRVGDSFEKIRAQVLSKERDINHLRYEVIEMRKKIHLGHPNLTKLFDIKHDEGGMVDIEFIIQFMVLAHAYQWPKLIQNIGNIALLNEFAELKLIDDSLASQVVKAYRLFRQSQHRLRLDGISPARIELENNLELASSKDAVIQLWQSVFLKL